MGTQQNVFKVSNQKFETLKPLNHESAQKTDSFDIHHARKGP